MLRKLRPARSEAERLRRLTDDDGAEAVEFAIVAPLALMVIFGIIYVLLALAAHVSLNHASSVAVRYASIPVDPVTDFYPTASDVHEKLTSSTPFFSPDACTVVVTPNGPRGRQNEPVSLDVSCEFPNPAGATFDALGALLGGTRNPANDTLTMTTAAEARRE